MSLKQCKVRYYNQNHQNHSVFTVSSVYCSGPILLGPAVISVAVPDPSHSSSGGKGGISGYSQSKLHDSRATGCMTAHCIAQPLLTLHCTAPNYIKHCYTALHFTTFATCTALQYTAPNCTELNCNELHCNTLHFDALL